MPAPPFDPNEPAAAPQPPPRPRFRPPVGIPRPADDRTRLGFGVSIALHGLILLLIIAPFASQELRDVVMPRGAGGPGPAGGGGGGSGGSGGVPLTERLRYIQVAPPPPEVEALVPPVEEKVEEEKPEPEEPEIKIDTDIPQPSLDVSMKIGIGGGTGNDGTRGTGPGSGGGIGTGQGTGTGSATGPGTGGGDGEIYSARPKQVFLPPYPRPERVKGTTVVVYFDLDERGRIIKIESAFTRDRDYNRRLREALAGTEFTPAHKPDGTPVPSRYPLIFEL